MKKAVWTQNEIDILLNYYFSKGANYISITLNRSIESIKTKARRIGLIKYSPQKWTDDEIKFLKENYENKGCKYVCEKLNTI